MDYTNFQKYPLTILGIDESYNEELTAIEEVVIDEIAYSGDADDLVDVLPYFVFYKFCEDKKTIVSTKGEMSQVAEFSVPSQDAQIRAWNIGADQLFNICAEKTQSANSIYMCEINLSCGFIL